MLSAFLGGLAFALPAGAADPWTIETFDAEISIRPDGALQIVESIDVDFGSLEKHGIFREIPVRYHWDDTRDRIYRLTVLSVTDASRRTLTYEVEDSGANQRLRMGDPDRTVSGKQTYRIAYRIEGALNAFPDYDELYWNVHGLEWEVGARRVTATVRLIGGLSRAACFQGPRGATEPCGIRSSADAVSFAATRPLAADEDLTVGVRLAKGAVVEPVPLLVPKPRGPDRWFETTPLHLGAAVLVLFAGGWGLWRLWLARGRDRSDGRAPTVVAEYEPPDRLRPAQIGLLMDERADTKDLTATIVDLAVRGYLRIEEGPKEGLFGKTGWRLTKLKGSDDLLPYEATLLGGLFATGDSALLSELRGSMASKLHQAQSELYANAVTQGWFPRNPDSARSLWAVAAILFFAASVGLVIALGSIAGFGLVGVVAAIQSVALLVLSPSMGQRSAVGHELARRTLGFRRYIETAEKDRASFAERENLFTEYLPYAIVFGAVGKWAAAFAGLDVTRAIGTWYAGSYGFNALSFSESLESFSSNVTNTIGYTPGSSGGSFSGGSSGGGGGGGGGGSW